MAIEKKQPAGKAEAGMSQQRRWLVFGSNVAIAIVLATALVVVAVWLSGVALRGWARSDWTATGRFSLSPRSKALLADLPFDVRITNLYSHAPEIPASEEQWQRVQDLLAEYELASSEITVEAINPAIDMGAVETLVGRLRERYAKELEAPKALVEEFAQLRKEIGELLAAEAKRHDEAADAWKGGPEDATGALKMVAQRWRQLSLVGEFTASSIQAMADQALPAYSSALARAKEYLSQIDENFGAVPDLYLQIKDLKAEPPPPEAVKQLLDAKDAYEPMRKRIAAFKERAAAVKEVELDSIRRDISQGEALLIETPDKVKVVSFDDVWIRNPGPQAEGTSERLFAGETAISSALLGLCFKEKPAILFVTAGMPATTGMPGPMGGGMRGQYMEVAERLRKSNFIVQDWDVLRSPQMPQPEGASKVILVLVPPPPPNRQMPMPPPSPEQFRPAIEAVRNGTPAIIMGEPASMFQQQVPYAELFELLGVEARFNAVAVHKVVVDASGKEQAIPRVDVTHYADHAITKPLGALPSIVVTASPLQIKSDLPEGLTVSPVIEMPGSRDYWADTVVFAALRGEAERDDADDIAGPVPLVVAATRQVGEGTQKAVLFGDSEFAGDGVLSARDPFGREWFPGNAELFLNACLWVSGTEHLITVSPEALEARRIGDMGGWTLPLQIIVIGGLPALVLAAGIVVYLVRRN